MAKRKQFTSVESRKIDIRVKRRPNHRIIILSSSCAQSC